MPESPRPAGERESRAAARERGSAPRPPLPLSLGAPSARLSPAGRGIWVWLAVALLLSLLALARPIDHDESQYVAAAALSARGLIPYRDYAYGQTPLQPLLLAPLVWAAGRRAWTALRLANALAGAGTLWCTWRATRLVAPAQAAVATALFAACDIFLFTAGVARNDALPALMAAAALWVGMRAEQGRGIRAGAAAAGLLLATAAATKLSYAFPAAAYGGWALLHPRAHRPVWVAAGTLPVLALLAWLYAAAPADLLFGAWWFPAHAPADYYADHPFKLTLTAKALDLIKFLALGPALLAAVAAVRHRRPALPAVLAVAGLVAAALPTTTWRQYLLPLLPPLFVLLAAAWAARPPGRVERVLAVAFAVAGLAPTALALAQARPGVLAGERDGAALAPALDRPGPVATLSPEFLPAAGRLPDPRFAMGPFFFRSRRLVVDEPARRVVSRGRLAATPLPALVLTGGEGKWTSGDDRLDTALAAEAARRGYRARPVADTPFTIWRR